MDVRRKRTVLLGAALVSALALAGCSDPLVPEPEFEVPGADLSIASGPYTPGQTYYSSNNWVEYHAGNLPIIIVAPHGGDLKLSSIPDRTPARCGVSSVVTVADANTAQLARSLKYRFHEYTGKYPHVIISKVHRSKVETNRNLAEGACGNATAKIVWQDFNAFIDVAENSVLNSAWGKGWYIDVHGHGHPIQRVELGYLLSAGNLRESNATLNGSTSYRNKSSFRTFATNSPFNFSDLLRGNKAIGTELGRRGYPSVPSKQDPSPNVGEPYFNGGYNTQTRACRSGGSICGLQIETYKVGIRDTEANRKNFSKAFVRAIDLFLGHNFEFSLLSPKGEIVVDNSNAVNDTTKAKFSASSNWGTYTDNKGKYLANFRRSTGDGPTNDGAYFDFKIPAKGTYSVYARWPASSSRSTSVRFRVYETIGGTRFYNGNQNQQQNGGEWVLLGTWKWTKTGWGRVLISRSLSGSGQIAADAIRVVRK